MIAILTYDQTFVRTATRSTLKMAANLTHIHNFKAIVHKEFKLFSKNTILTIVDTLRISA